MMKLTTNLDGVGKSSGLAPLVELRGATATGLVELLHQPPLLVGVRQAVDVGVQFCQGHGRGLPGAGRPGLLPVHETEDGVGQGGVVVGLQQGGVGRGGDNRRYLANRLCPRAPVLFHIALQFHRNLQLVVFK